MYDCEIVIFGVMYRLVLILEVWFMLLIVEVIGLEVILIVVILDVYWYCVNMRMKSFWVIVYREIKIGDFDVIIFIYIIGISDSGYYIFFIIYLIRYWMVLNLFLIISKCICIF